MKINFKDVLLVTGGTTLFLSPLHLFAAQNKCEASADTVHCASVQGETGKYIKVKETQKGHTPTSMIMCANSQTALSIAQNQVGQYQLGETISWQFSQCIDEDCTASRSLADDKFTITRSGKLYTSSNKKVVNIILDPSFGQDCKVEKTNVQTKNHLLTSSLDMRIDDAVALLEAVPTAMTQTATILNNMRTIALDAANNSHTPQELINLNNEFQTLKDAIDMAQRVNTLDGYKTVSGGTITISIGSWYSFATLTIPLPPTDKYSLNIYGQNVLTSMDASAAVSTIDDALNVVSYALSIKM